MKIRSVLLSACVALAAFSCAKMESEDPDAIEARSLARWMAAHVDDPGLVEHGGGLYTIVERQPADPSSEAPASGGWVDINYTGYALPVAPVATYPANGSVFVTRDAAMAARERANNPFRTHYAPHRMPVSDLYGSMTAAMMRTLLMMKKGETRRMFATSAIMFGAYGSQYGYGYQGQTALAAGAPSYMDIELVEVIPDIAEHERKQVWENARTALGKTSETDTLRKGLYLNATYLGTADPADTAKDTITADSTVNIYYVKRFLDGFIIDTNIDTVAQRVWGSGANLAAVSYKPSSSSGSGVQLQALYEAVTKMRYNSRGTMAFTSDWGHSYSGVTPTTTDYATQIDPYTPLVVEFYIAPYTKAATDMEEESYIVSDLSAWNASGDGPSWTYKPYNYTGYWSLSGEGNAVASQLQSPGFALHNAVDPRLYVTFRVIRGESGDVSALRLFYSNGAVQGEIPLASFPAQTTAVGPILLSDYSPGADFRLRFAMDSGGKPTDIRCDISKIEFRRMVESED